jgi:hypothetical protein
MSGSNLGKSWIAFSDSVTMVERTLCASTCIKSYLCFNEIGSNDGRFTINQRLGLKCQCLIYQLLYLCTHSEKPENQ